MKNLISFKVATNLSLVIFRLLALFHLAIIIGIVLFHYAPIEFLWGGRMETKNQLLGFEFISFFVTTLSIMAVLIHSNRIKAPKLKNTARICLWVLFIIFVLNTLGNALAETSFEKSFSIVTAILAILCLRQAIESRKNDQ